MCENPSPLIVNRVMTRDNVALGVIFETKGAPGKCLVFDFYLSLHPIPNLSTNVKLSAAWFLQAILSRIL